jgi:hypothetical protein
VITGAPVGLRVDAIRFAPPAFVYGTTQAYGSITRWETVARSGPIDVASNVRHLSPGTTYHYKLAVLEGSYPASFTSCGADAQFTTKPAKRVGSVKKVARR